MPLPQNDVAWPPKAFAELLPSMTTWAAWWTGDTEALRRSYSTSTGGRVRPSQSAGGVVGAVSRWFWGRPSRDLTAPARHQMHIPLAADLVKASADLLFSERPTITVDATDGDGVQARLDQLLDDHFWRELYEGGEVNAALGSVYHRVTVDTSVSTTPFVTTVQADAAVPEFRWGRLVAVTFWSTVKVENGARWRHLERHELDAFGNGIVLHGLYRGNENSLGRAVPLNDAGVDLGVEVNELGEAVAFPRTPGLGVVLIPNITPAKSWRNQVLGTHLGRSDLDGIEPLLDAIDEVVSDWMRNARLAKPRLFVADSALDDDGPGAGASFDLDREVFTKLNVLTGRDDSGLPVRLEQSKIMVEDYSATLDALVVKAISAAGYSPATFAEGTQTGSPTATEIKARERRSFLTRDRKVKLYSPAISDLVTKLMAIDRELNPAHGHTPDRVRVIFPDGVTESVVELAQTASAMRAAGAASTRTLVRLMHPDWDEQAIDAEVELINEEDTSSADAPVTA